MSLKTLNTRIRQRIDTTANWTTNSSTVLADGELGLERTTNGNIKIKVGDNVHTWAELPYINTGGNNGSSYEAGNGIKIENNTISTIYGDAINEWDSYNFGELISTLNIDPATDLDIIFDEINMHNTYVELVKYITEPELFTNLTNNQFKIEIKLQNINLISQIFTMATATQIANNNNNDDSTLIKTIENIELAENTTLNIYYTGKTDALAYYMAEGEENETEYNELTEIIDRICFITIDINNSGSHFYQFMCEIPLDIASITEYFSIYKIKNGYQTIPSTALKAGKNIEIGNNATIINTLGNLIEDYQNPGWELNNDKIYTHPSAPLFGSVYAYQYTTYTNNNTNYYGLTGLDFGDILTGCPIYSNFILYDKKGNRVNQLTDTLTVSDYGILKIRTSLSDLIDVKLSFKYNQATLWNNIFGSLNSTQGKYIGTMCFGGGFNTSDDIEDILDQGYITPDDNALPALYFLINTKDYSKTSNMLDFIILTNTNQLNLGSYRILQPSISYNTIPFNSLSTGNAIGYGSLAAGKNNEVIGIGSFAMGQDNRVYANYAAAIGQNIYNNNEYSLIIGNTNDQNISPMFAIGNSLGKNAFHILESGQAYKLSASDSTTYVPYLTPENISTYLDYTKLSNTPTIPSIINNISNNTTDTVNATSPYAVYTYVNSFAQGAMYFRGTTSTTIIDGENTSNSQIVISNNTYTPQAGDVVLNNGNEFVYDGYIWHKLGDESSWVPSTRTINGHALSSNISLTASDVGAITSSDITDKPSRASSSNTTGNFVTWDSSGNLADSGYKIVVSANAPTVNNQNVITFIT